MTSEERRAMIAGLDNDEPANENTSGPAETNGHAANSNGVEKPHHSETTAEQTS